MPGLAGTIWEPRHIPRRKWKVRFFSGYNKAVDCLKNGGMVEIVDKVSDMGKVNPPENKEVIKSFSGASHVQSFFVFVQECKECGRKSFNH